MPWTPDARTVRVLATVVPEMREKVLQLLEYMHSIGAPMTATDGNRTTSEQQALYAQGRTKPGRIVTNADGIKKKSNHQGGRAVDCTFVDAHGKPHWPDAAPWKEYGTAAKSLGLKWGGDFKSMKGGDRPHVELP